MTTSSPKNTQPLRFRNCCKALKGFSLIEVTLALGVTAVALITLIGMVPVGLNTFRTAIETTVRTDVTRRIIADLQQTPFASISNSSSPIYFTDEGIPVGNSPTTNSVFKVDYSVDSNAKLPGASTNTTSLKRVFVKFYTQQDQAKNGPSTYTNVVYVADNGL